MNNFQLYIFDLDGTILDSKEDIAISVNYALERVGISPRPSEEIVKFVGYGAKKLIDDLFPELPQGIREEILGHFREFYSSNPVIKSTLYPRTEEIIQSLKKKGRHVAVVTNKYESISIDILKHFGIYEFIDMVVGADTTPEKKPNPLPVYYTLDRLNQREEYTVIIGDSETDVQTGKNAGISTCLVLHGYGKKEIALSMKPDFVIRDFYDFEVER